MGEMALSDKVDPKLLELYFEDTSRKIVTLRRDYTGRLRDYVTAGIRETGEVPAVGPDGETIEKIMEEGAVERFKISTPFGDMKIARHKTLTYGTVALKSLKDFVRIESDGLTYHDGKLEKGDPACDVAARG